MRIPEDAVVADEKLNRYLLIERPWDDKSGFLRRAGFTLETWTDLRDAIRGLAGSADAVEENGSGYGTFYRVEGMLVGPIATLPVTLIWMQRAADKQFHFVTLKPRKESDR
jgi:hypothetical protein